MDLRTKLSGAKALSLDSRLLVPVVVVLITLVAVVIIVLIVIVVVHIDEV